MTLLGTYRVLDLSDERGHIAGFLLAQLGADVVLVESRIAPYRRYRWLRSATTEANAPFCSTSEI